MSQSCFVWLSLTFVLPASQALAWDQDGHSIVAELAQRRLSDKARSDVEAILGRGVSLASIASWADDWRAAHRETTRWHFVNIDVANSSFAAPRDCAAKAGEGDCLVAELGRATKILADPLQPAIDKRTALKFVVHFTGDLTQPLHCSERADDAGGNLLYVDFDGRKEHRKAIRFHALWDETLIQERTYDWGAFVEDLEASEIPLLDLGAVSSGTFEDWAIECHQAGIEAYEALPPAAPSQNDPEHPIALGSAYADATLPILKRQLMVGGLRLAKLLNDTLGRTGR